MDQRVPVVPPVGLVNLTCKVQVAHYRKNNVELQSSLCRIRVGPKVKGNRTKSCLIPELYRRCRSPTLEVLVDKLEDPAPAGKPLLVEAGEPGRNQHGTASPSGSTRETRQPYV